MNSQTTIDEARKFANGSHLGKSAHRELDRAILLIRDLLAIPVPANKPSDLPGFAEIMLDPEIGERALAIVAEHRTPPPEPTAEALAVTPKEPGIYLDAWGNTWRLHGDGVFMMSGFPRQDPTAYAPFTRLVPERTSGSGDGEVLAIARNIVNQIGELYYERISSPDWVRVRQETNDELDAFAARLILGFLRAVQGEPSDAAVLAALNAYRGYYREDDGPGDPSLRAMRAALRAAAATEGGERRG